MGHLPGRTKSLTNHQHRSGRIGHDVDYRHPHVVVVNVSVVTITLFERDGIVSLADLNAGGELVRLGDSSIDCDGPAWSSNAKRCREPSGRIVSTSTTVSSSAAILQYLTRPVAATRRADCFIWRPAAARINIDPYSRRGLQGRTP